MLAADQFVIAPRVRPSDDVRLRAEGGACRLLDGLELALSAACVGSISEIYDAEPPFAPRGCVAQAWSVAEALRALAAIAAVKST